MPNSLNRIVGVEKYLVGTITTGHFKNMNNISIVEVRVMHMSGKQK